MAIIAGREIRDWCIQTALRASAALGACVTSVSKPGVYFRSLSVCFGLGGEQISQCGVSLMHSRAWGALNPGTVSKRGA